MAATRNKRKAPGSGGLIVLVGFAALLAYGLFTLLLNPAGLPTGAALLRGHVQPRSAGTGQDELLEIAYRVHEIGAGSLSPANGALLDALRDVGLERGVHRVGMATTRYGDDDPVEHAFVFLPPESLASFVADVQGRVVPADWKRCDVRCRVVDRPLRTRVTFRRAGLLGRLRAALRTTVDVAPGDLFDARDLAHPVRPPFRSGPREFLAWLRSAAPGDSAGAALAERALLDGFSRLSIELAVPDSAGPRFARISP